MAQRRHHYEQAFAHYLRERRIPYVAVDEARKALLPPGSPRAGSGTACDVRADLKSFDFVIYGPGGNFLCEVKGRKLGRPPSRPGACPPVRPRAPGRLECWVTQDDVESLLAWEGLFGDDFRAAFVFIYWCQEQPALPLFEELFEYPPSPPSQAPSQVPSQAPSRPPFAPHPPFTPSTSSNWYAIRSITVRDYQAAMRPRSLRWRTVHLPAAEFDRLSRAALAPLLEARR